MMELSASMAMWTARAIMIFVGMLIVGSVCGMLLGYRDRQQQQMAERFRAERKRELW